LQLVLFASSWNVPGGHRRAACPAPSTAYAPGTDTQAARLAEPAGDSVSAGQATHASVETLYSPAAHGVHATLPTATLIAPPAHATQSYGRLAPAGAKPGVHKHMPACVEPAMDTAAAGHGRRSCARPPGQ
jgi:hypothetical protein